MSSTLQQALDSLKAGRPAATERLHSLIRIASVSNAPGFDTELDAAIKAVGAKMKGDRTKNRVTVYYLLAEHFGKLSTFGGAAKA